MRIFFVALTILPILSRTEKGLIPSSINSNHLPAYTSFMSEIELKMGRLMEEYQNLALLMTNARNALCPTPPTYAPWCMYNNFIMRMYKKLSSLVRAYGSLTRVCANEYEALKHFPGTSNKSQGIIIVRLFGAKFKAASVASVVEKLALQLSLWNTSTPAETMLRIGCALGERMTKENETETYHSGNHSTREPPMKVVCVLK
ncbi:unnamed protein product [Cylicocyclus nassatus]|uniref:Uncharacterized protein n=1 Tax=Cylicocyclus nassatus TaxID=53992 RepID=A0AA36DL79_CYLNA|nr:unnamed protein product [Cylicocyclus nassatus]